MSLRKRKESEIWFIDIVTPSGERVRQSTGTSDRKKALEYHDAIKANLWTQQRLGIEAGKTFDEAAIVLLKHSEGQKDYQTKIRHIKFFRNHFKNMPVSSLTPQMIMDVLPTHKVTPSGKSVELSNATKNRYLSTMIRLLTLCEERRWISKRPKLSKFKEAKVNIRWITHKEAEKLINSAQSECLRDLITFALATGMRAKEIFTLRWSSINIERRTTYVSAEEAKSSFARSVPLNSTAVDVIRRRIGKHHTYVFTREVGKNALPIKQINTREWRLSIERAGIQNFRFHDLRHTWASWHAQAGTPLLVLKDLGGWETIEMVQKYAHLSESHLADFAENIGTFMAQSVSGIKKAVRL